MVLWIRELMQVNPAKVHRIQYQEYIINVLNDIAKEKNAKNPAYFQSYGTALDMAKYDIQVRKYKQTIKVNNLTVATETLSIYMLKSHARMTQEMMEWVAPLSNKYLNMV
eukprot:8356606-Ditylum_brightwellii.AAC.1